MGWFDTDIDNVLYSDETLDLAYNFLKKFSEIYQNDLKRKPSIEELEYLLKTSFSVNLDNTLILDFEEKRLEDIKFKIGERKKKQKYEVGDVCVIPLNCGGYAFARILMLQPPSWYLSEIFAYYSKDKTYRPEIDKQGDLIYPIFITPNDYNRWNSDIIHRESGYFSPRLDQLSYYYGLPGNYYLVKPGKDNERTSIGDIEIKKYAKQTFYHSNDIVKIIEEALMEKELIK